MSITQQLNTAQSLNWPPAYNLRKSKRAKCVQLKISVARGLEVILPQQHNLVNVELLLAERRQWIEKHLQRVYERRQQIPAPALPSSLKLNAINQEWQIIYEAGLGEPRLHEVDGSTLRISGNFDYQSGKQLLIQWLRKYASVYLKTWLDKISHEIVLPYSKFILRGQKTRWGSCTSTKVISLNYKLIFLAPEIVRYVIIHELCHTQRMDHSTIFWDWVERFDKCWEWHRAQLNHAYKIIPNWLES